MMIKRMILSLVLAIVFLATPLKTAAAQKPGVVDWIDLNVGGTSCTFPVYTSQYLGSPKKAKKRLSEMYSTYSPYYKDCLCKKLEYDDSSKLIAIYEFDGSTKKISGTTTFEYDSKGRMMKSNFISASEELISWTIYDYDEQDRLIKMSSYTQKTGDNPGSYFNYYYKNGRVKKTDGWAYMGGNTKGRYMYNKKGNLIKEFRRGVLVSKFKYDELGRPIRHITYSSDGQSVIDDSTFSYDSDGYITSVFHNEKVLQTFVYESIP